MARRNRRDSGAQSVRGREALRSKVGGLLLGRVCALNRRQSRGLTCVKVAGHAADLLR